MPGCQVASTAMPPSLTLVLIGLPFSFSRVSLSISPAGSPLVIVTLESRCSPARRSSASASVCSASESDTSPAARLASSRNACGRRADQPAVSSSASLAERRLPASSAFSASVWASRVSRASAYSLPMPNSALRFRG